MAQAILKLDKITKDYKVADSVVHALKGVSLSFRKKEFVSILGASGCGKTTLLNIVGGLDKYTSGDLVIKGVSTKHYKDGDWDAYRNHSIGFVFQSYNLIPHQTVLGNVELALTLSGVSVQERRLRATEALQRVGLGAELNKKPNQLSGGQMQRVAIARALVNNPEILLADEPTGALDTKTSVQIMDLIKEIAGERLVIMVTHNPELARQYSSRIVELKDGTVISDSNPFKEDEQAEEETAAAEKNKPGKEDVKSSKAKKKAKTSMSWFTALRLSGRNLLTKKGRTLVTSIAGSIGIISVCLVLALSNGFNNYIRKTEEDMLSYYPIEINETSLDLTQAMTSFMGGGTKLDIGEKIEDKVYINSFLTQLAQGMTTSNDLSSNNVADISGQKMSYLAYVDAMPQDYYNAITYGYGVSLTRNLFTDLRVGSTTVSSGMGLGDPVYYDYHISLAELRNYYTTILTSTQTQYGSLTRFVDYFTDVVNFMPGTGNVSDENYGEYILSQYDVFGEFPDASDEAVLVVGPSNDVIDLTMAQLGYLDEENFLGLFQSGLEGNDIMEIPFEEILSKTFTLYDNDEVFTETDGSAYRYDFNAYHEVSQKPSGKGTEIKVVGILRLKDGLTYGCLGEGLNLTEQLLHEYLERNAQTGIVQYLNANPTAEIDTLAGYVPLFNLLMGNATGMPVQQERVFSKESVASTAGLVRILGGDMTPNSVQIYAMDFDTKDLILTYLDQWNDAVNSARQAYYDANGSYDGYDGPSEVKYTDTVGVLMGLMQTILDAITYVLIAFTGISLVVSTVMIGVITYVSVVERTKEIGILRSIGARKKDIKHMFNAETFIIGFCAGLIGIIVAYLLELLINAILTPLTGIAGLASLTWYAALIMVVISVVLTLISGLLPASAAAKRDPVIALRTE